MYSFFFLPVHRYKCGCLTLDTKTMNLTNKGRWMRLPRHFHCHFSLQMHIRKENVFFPNFVRSPSFQYPYSSTFTPRYSCVCNIWCYYDVDASHSTTCIYTHGNGYVHRIEQNMEFMSELMSLKVSCSIEKFKSSLVLLVMRFFTSSTFSRISFFLFAVLVSVHIFH